MADSKILLTKIAHRVDSTANWTDSNPVLLKGELAITMDAGALPKLKIGVDGVKKWSEIDYTYDITALGDTKSIDFDGKTLSIHDFGKYYYAYDAEHNTYNSAKTEGWRAGLEPKVRLVSDATGTYEIAWYEPNPTTVEGLSTSITGLQQTVGTMESNYTTVTGNITTLEDKVATLEGQAASHDTDLTDLKANVYRKSEVYTKSETNEEISAAVAAQTHMTTKVITNTDEVDSANVIYLIKDENATGTDKYLQYLLIDDQAVCIGDTTTNLDGYVTDNELVGTVNELVGQIATQVETLNGKIDLKANIADVYTQGQTDTKISDAIEELENELGDVSTVANTASTNVNNLTQTVNELGQTHAADKATLEESIAGINTKFNSYYTSGQVDTKLSDYATTNVVNNTISGINTNIQNINNTIAALNDTYATDAELEAAVEALEGQIDDVEGKFDNYVPITRKVTVGTIEKVLSADITITLAELGGETPGGAQEKAASALADAKEYTDDEINAATEDITGAYQTADKGLSDRIDAIQNSYVKVYDKDDPIEYIFDCGGAAAR